LRNGPLVRRSAQVLRAAQAAPTRLRRSAPLRSQCRQLATITDLGLPNSQNPQQPKESSCAHLECRLPINLRQFLAEQMGSALQEDDHNLLKLAANADRATLSKLARAIRRYSTERAHEAWTESAVALSRFVYCNGSARPLGVLCLKCGSIDFDGDSSKTHQTPGCLTVSLEAALVKSAKVDSRSEALVANQLQRLIEEFRALRVAFGLPHFQLDSYVKNHQVIFTWRPLPSA